MKDIDYFHNKHHYERYLWAVSIAEKINELIDTGHVIFDDEGHAVTGKFEFRYSDDTPKLNFRESATLSIMYLCTTTAEDKYWVPTKKEFRKDFTEKFNKIVHPKDIKKLKL